MLVLIPNFAARGGLRAGPAEMAGHRDGDAQGSARRRRHRRLLALARIAGETAPLLFTALSNQFWTSDLSEPMANLPVTIFKFAMSPYENWQQLAWAGVFLITLGVLALNILARTFRATSTEADARHGYQGRAARVREGQDLGARPEFLLRPFQALRNINLDIPERKVTAFIGPSGCGKSTLLRTFNRMFELYPEQRAEGEIMLDGENMLTTEQDVVADSRHARHGVPEADAVPDVDLRQHRFRRALFETLPRVEMDERVEWALKKAALWDEVKDKLDQSGAGLSGGQQQRLCIARGIAIKPEVLLLDEPCSALDPISTGKIEELIHELKTDYTVVIVTHNMQQAARISDYTAYMYLGDLIEFGATVDLFMKPKKKDTEDYITGRFG